MGNPAPTLPHDSPAVAVHRLRCGDTVQQEGTDYHIEVAYADYATGWASWMGWPEGVVEISRLTLIKAATDEEHKQSVARWLDGSHSSEQMKDHRRACVKRLYRPRAYALEQHTRAEQNLAFARSCVETTAAELAKALQGPEDA